MDDSVVTPTLKKYTFSCSADIFLSDPDHQMYIIYALLGLVAFFVLYLYFSRSNRYTKMYKFLRERVLDAPNLTLNVTHTMTDLEA